MSPCLPKQVFSAFMITAAASIITSFHDCMFWWTLISKHNETKKFWPCCCTQLRILKGSENVMEQWKGGISRHSYDAVLMCWNALILAYILFRLRCQGEHSDLDSFYNLFMQLLKNVPIYIDRIIECNSFIIFTYS